MADVSIPAVPTADDFAKALSALDGTRYSVLLLLAGLVVFGVIAYMLHRYWVMKDAARAESMKEARGQRLTDALSNMAASHLKLAEAHSLSSNRLALSLEVLGEMVGHMDGSVVMLQQRVTGQLSKAISMRLARMIYSQSVTPAMKVLMSESLAENRFLERKQYIRDRIRTEMAKILSGAREELAQYPLAFPFDSYFGSYPDATAGSERFHLCDELWQSLEPMYTKAGSLEERTDEAMLAVTNCIQDHISIVERGFATSVEASKRRSGEVRLAAGETTRQTAAVHPAV